MTFDELLDRNPQLLLADFIKLCLMGQDDKVYIDLYVYGAYGYEDDYLEDLRVIDDELQPYYDYDIIGIYTAERIVLQIVDRR